MARQQTQKVFSPQQSRQGPKGRPVLKVLLVSLALTAIVWFIIDMQGRSEAPVIAPDQTLNPGASGGEAFDNNPPQGSKPAGQTDRPNP